MSMSKEGEPKKRKGLSGLLLAACAIIGMGIGFAFDEVAVGIFIGLGVGFLAMFRGCCINPASPCAVGN